MPIYYEQILVSSENALIGGTITFKQILVNHFGS